MGTVRIHRQHDRGVAKLLLRPRHRGAVLDVLRGRAVPRGVNRDMTQTGLLQAPGMDDVDTFVGQGLSVPGREHPDGQRLPFLVPSLHQVRLVPA